MSDLYDSETDGLVGSESQIHEHKMCDFCGGKGKVWYGYGGYDFLYECPQCKGGGI